MKERGEWPPPLGENHLVEFLVAAVGNLELDVKKRGGLSLRFVAPDLPDGGSPNA